ncbi:phosphatase PAP2 family protein [Pleomorphomonas sp. PLEO]|uniref:phosphatase PAP2 family protein n=1 Tax=Pleomorphomonas sp. PLEO TaxID=3239306 RepID=UPI00351E8005
MQTLLKLTQNEIIGDRQIYSMIAIYILSANIILIPAGHIFENLFIEYTISLVILDIVTLPAIIIAGLLIRSILADPHHPTDWLRSRIDRRRAARILAGLVLLLAFVPFMATFTAMKSFIGLSGFTADVPLADLDRWLHLGVDPAVFLHRVFDYGVVWRFFAAIYGPGWMLWVDGFVFWMAVAAPTPDIRKRFFIGYIFAWAVLGNVVAWLAISAGPAFFAQVTGNADRFASVLAAVGAHTLPDGSGIRDIQTYLWDLYVSRSSGFGMGISAFPSLHVAMVTLCALVAFEISRILAIVGVIIVILIEMGSVLFGWHYAIDGYFSIAVMAAVWGILRRPYLLGRPSIDQSRAALHHLAEYPEPDRRQPRGAPDTKMH